MHTENLLDMLGVAMLNCNAKKPLQETFTTTVIMISKANG